MSSAPDIIKIKPSKRDGLRVFLSHTSEDNEVVSKLYDLLKGQGYEPWMDTRDISVGALWEQEISEALRKAEAIIFCLSNSTAHAERALSEIRWAFREQRNEGIPHLIPARLEECPVPTELASLYHADLFKKDGYDKLVSALNKVQIKVRGATLSIGSAALGASDSFALSLHEWRVNRQRPISNYVPDDNSEVNATDPGTMETAGGDVGESGEVKMETAASPENAGESSIQIGVDPAGQSDPTGEGGVDYGVDYNETREVRVDYNDTEEAGVEQSQTDSDEAAHQAGAAETATATPRIVKKSGLDEAARTRSATNDKPQTDVERDTLGFRDFVFALRDFIVSEDTTTPLTISVNGAWGSGKSSLMGMLQQQLEAPPPAGLWRVKLGWLGRWARATPVALAGRLLAWSGHWDAEHIRLGLCFAPAEEVTDENFEELLRAHVAAAVGAQFSPALLDSMEADRANAYVAGIMDRSRRWARAAARRRKMKPHDHPTVWFNAWKFSEQEQVWSALALALLEQLKTKYNFFERALFLARLTLKRTDRRRAVAQLARRLLVPSALVIAAVAYASLYETLKARYESYFVLPANWTWLAPALAAAWQAWKAVENPFHLPAAEIVDQPDYREKVGFLGAFGEDFARIVETAVRRSFFWRPRKLVVFVDDLDRCSPLQAAGVIEAINLFLDSVGCVFVLGMDMAAVATSIEVKYKELAERMRQDSPDLLSPGSLFLDKIVQIPFNVPRPNRERIDDLVTSITEPRAQAPRLALMPPPPAPREEIAPPTFAAAAIADGHDAAGDNGRHATATAGSATTTVGAAATTEAAATEAAGTTEATKHPSDDGAAGASQTAAAPQVDRGSFARKDIKEAVVYASQLLKENPRQVKRFVNLFRLQIYIADQRGLLSEESEQGLTPKRLAVWVAWYMQWPELLKPILNATYDDDLRRELIVISRDLYATESNGVLGAWWPENDKRAFLSRLATTQQSFKDSPSHWSNLPWQVWLNDEDFLRCLKDLELYWKYRRLLDSVADMTQFSIDPPSGVAADASPAPPAPAKSPASAAHAHAGNGGSPAL